MEWDKSRVQQDLKDHKDQPDLQVPPVRKDPREP